MINPNEDINKVLTFLAMIKGTKFETEEFTSKDFNQAFKGTREFPSDISLMWLRENCALNNCVRYNPYRPWRNNDIESFIIVARVEDFELPYKEMPWGGYEKTEVVKNTDGEIVDVNLDAYKTDTNYRKFINSQYGDCTIVIEEKKTFTAHRNFYRVNLKALESVKPSIEKTHEYYEKRLAKAKREVEKFEKALALVK